MLIAQRLVFFLATLLTYYACQRYPSTLHQKKPLVIKRTLYVSLLVSGCYLLSNFLFFQILKYDLRYGNKIVTDLVTAALISLLVTSLSFLAPKNKLYLTGFLKKILVFLVLLLTLATATLFSEATFLKNTLIFSGMYFFFTLAFVGIQDRIAIAPIPKFLKGLPLDFLIMFLLLLSFSFLNGVFFDQLF